VSCVDKFQADKPRRGRPPKAKLLEGTAPPPASESQEKKAPQSTPGQARAPPADRHALLTFEQVADWFGVSVSILNQARLTGTGPKFVRLLKGGVVRYSVGSCLDCLAERTAKDTSEPIPE
jgi:hypothetical protein